MAAACVFHLAFGLIEIINEPQTCENWYRTLTAAEVAVAIIIIIIIIIPATGKRTIHKET
jgi:hypothetical protein